MSVSVDGSFMRDMSVPRYSGTDFYYQRSKIKLFGDIFYKKHPQKTEFVLQTHFLNRNAEVISHPLQIYEDSAKFILEKGSKWKITNCITDPNVLESTIYTIKINNRPHEFILKATPFNRY